MASLTSAELQESVLAEHLAHCVCYGASLALLLILM